MPGSSSPSRPQPEAIGGLHWKAWGSEFAGTLVLVAVGLSAVCFNFGKGMPLDGLPMSLRYLLTGLWFAGTGALLALSPLGRLSGAHVDPIITGGFFLLGKLHRHDLVGYVIAQFAGALAGAALLLAAWGPVARSVEVGATTPGPGVSGWEAVLIEAGIGAIEVLTVIGMLSSKRTARFTPLALWLVNATLVWRTAALTGTSLNPARSFGPAVLAPALDVYWIYVIGPVAGMLIGVGVYRLVGRVDVVTTKLFHDVRYSSTGVSDLPVRQP
ncbi:MIP/aquaporin family protein [Amnibacterium endophyticum]|uniref:MIP/aquaporin family protein n=1 Tax=Amnibacterium endophyticum TaxID=2109337 RepID=A0ABW4LAM5_9MICO